MKTPVEVKGIMHSLRSAILTNAACASAYDSWSDKFSREDIRKAWLGHGYTKLTIDEIKQLSREELYSFGFMRWSDELLVIPLYLFNLIADGEELYCIDGSTEIKEAGKIDLDVRGGCIAFGFTHPN